MKSIAMLVRLAPFAFMGLASIAAGQAGGGGGDTLNRASSCQASGIASRRRESACEEPETTAVRGEAEIAIATPLPARQITVCAANVGVGYFQSNTLAKVESTIQIEGCPGAVTGQYTVAARVRDAAGEVKVLEFPETFGRDGDQRITVKGEYPIGEGAELVSLRVRSVRCDCVEQDEAGQAETGAEGGQAGAEPSAAEPSGAEPSGQ